jgi:hypothetical protein
VPDEGGSRGGGDEGFVHLLLAQHVHGATSIPPSVKKKKKKKKKKNLCSTFSALEQLDSVSKGSIG